MSSPDEHFEMSDKDMKNRKGSTSSSDERKSSHSSWDWIPHQVWNTHHHYPVYPHPESCCDSPDQKHLHKALPKSEKKMSAFQLWQKRYRRQKALSPKPN